MYPTELEARRQIVTYSHKTQAHGLVSATDGNLSVRIGEDRIVITPSSLRKEEMTIDDPIVIDMAGELVAGDRRPSTERKVHLEAYRRRPDIRAVIHAHPPKAIAFTIAEAPLDTCVLPEVVVTLGSVPIAPYATPSTEDLPASMSDLIARSDVVMLARHGSVTVGSDLSDAFKKLEKLEHNAEILIYSRILGGAKPFADSDIERLQGLRDFYGIRNTSIACATGAGRPEAQGSASPSAIPASAWGPVEAPTWRGAATGCAAAPGSAHVADGTWTPSEAQMNELVDEIVRRVAARLR